MKRGLLFMLAPITVALASCGGGTAPEGQTEADTVVAAKVAQFVKVPLKADITHLSDREKQMLPLLFEAAQLMDDIFWLEAYGDKEELLNSLPSEAEREFALINYGPWERLNGNIPFVKGVDDKPLGANFYPEDMTKEEYEAWDDLQKDSQYTVIRRDAEGKLIAVPYHEAFKDKIELAATILDQAASLADDKGLKNYLTKRAEALRTDNYQPSDFAWMDMKSNRIDFVVGPIENYEDHLFGNKAAHEAFILIKDMEWSQRLAHYMALLPRLQENLPVEPKYKAEKPGSDSDLGVYDVVFYGGDCNAGSKTIAINLPNDAEVQLQKGSRKLQLRNAMQYKFDRIMKPIADLLIVPEQREHVKFPAFFENTMFHEVAHGLGVKNTLDGKRTAREALGASYSAIEEGKADILGIFMIEQLAKMGELKEHEMMDNYVTFLAGIFRSVRFGAASAHGKANMVRFHFFQERGAFTRDSATGLYQVNGEKMSAAVEALARELLVLQGDGNAEGAAKMLAEQGVIDPELQGDLDRINEANIPIDIRFEQGPALLGLEKK